jgi:DUF4097 and DUF4098 domain-containing protein YvlB
VVEFRLGSDDVEVISRDVTDATFFIKKTWRANERDYGEKIIKDARITIEREGDRLVVKRERSKERDTWDMMTKGYVSIDITATIPAGLSLDIETGSGDVDLDDREGPVKVIVGSGDVVAGDIDADFELASGSGDLHVGVVTGMCEWSSGSGDITAEGGEGRVEISTGSGDVDIDSVTGSLRVSTGSGDVDLGTLEGSLYARTSSGDVTVLDQDGETDIGTSSGDVSLRCHSDKGLLKVDTSSGDVDIALYATESMKVDLRTSTGAIRTKVPLVVEEASRRRLLARAGTGGDLVIDVSTASGDINIRQGSI